MTVCWQKSGGYDGAFWWWFATFFLSSFTFSLFAVERKVRAISGVALCLLFTESAIYLPAGRYFLLKFQAFSQDPDAIKVANNCNLWIKRKGTVTFDGYQDFVEFPL